MKRVEKRPLGDPLKMLTHLKRKRTSDQDEEKVMNCEENKKLKVTPQNLQRVERKMYRKEEKIPPLPQF